MQKSLATIGHFFYESFNRLITIQVVVSTFEEIDAILELGLISFSSQISNFQQAILTEFFKLLKRYCLPELKIKKDISHVIIYCGYGGLNIANLVN